MQIHGKDMDVVIRSVVHFTHNFIHNSNSMKHSYNSYQNYKEGVSKTIGTFHENTTVVACTKLCSDLMVGNLITA